MGDVRTIKTQSGREITVEDLTFDDALSPEAVTTFNEVFGDNTEARLSASTSAVYYTLAKTFGPQKAYDIAVEAFGLPDDPIARRVIYGLSGFYNNVVEAMSDDEHNAQLIYLEGILAATEEDMHEAYGQVFLGSDGSIEREAVDDVDVAPEIQAVS